MKATVLGRNGFIGRELYSRLRLERYTVYSYLRPDVDIVFAFNSPSSQILFQHAPDYCLKETVQGFQNVLDFCSKYKIKLIYPSTVSHSNLYADVKRTLEDVQWNHWYKNVLGVRISAGYGLGEFHKGEYASVVYQFIEQMKEGKRPVIFGDGKQTRDFIYIDDIVDGIMENLDRKGLITLSTEVNTSFNDLVKIINKQLKKRIRPIYIEKPKQYLQNTPVESDYKCKVSLEKGIERLVLCT